MSSLCPLKKLFASELRKKNTLYSRRTLLQCFFLNIVLENKKMISLLSLWYISHLFPEFLALTFWTAIILHHHTNTHCMTIWNTGLSLSHSSLPPIHHQQRRTIIKLAQGTINVVSPSVSSNKLNGLTCQEYVVEMLYLAMSVSSETIFII